MNADYADPKNRPTIVDVYSARRRIQPYLQRTLLASYPALDALAGAKLYIKHENHQPIGAFKVRGGINLISQLTEDQKRRGVVTASTGNHGQSIAYASRIFGVKATVIVPEGANPIKVASIRNNGAEVIFHGTDFDDARLLCEQRATEEGLRYVHSGDEPRLIAGVGTLTLEILEDAPDVEAIVVPIGGGSNAAGACIVAKAVNPRIKVIGVQSERAPAGYKSWAGKKLVEDKMETAAEGLAARTAFELPQRILWEHLDDFVLVKEEEIQHAILVYLENARTVAEGAGAASLAAMLKLTGSLAAKKVALVLSGGNLTVDQLRAVLASR
jgi:threonine dehydratase